MWKIVLLLFCLLPTSILSENLGINEEIEPLNTAITDLYWERIEDPHLNNNHSHFQFDVDFDILNPNNFDVNLTFSSLTIFFPINITISFSKQDYSYYDHYGGTHLPESGTETYDSGITTDKSNLTLTVEEKNLLELPEGRYDLRVICPSNTDDVVPNITRITIQNGRTIIQFLGTTVNVGNPLSNALIVGVVFFSYILVKRKKRKQLW